MSSFLGWIWPLIGGAAAWLIVQFAAEPYLRFRSLRSSVQRQLLTLETSFFVPLAMHNPMRAAMIGTYNSEIEDQAKALRENGIALVAMADTEQLLGRLLKAGRYDIRMAGSALMALPISMR